MQDQPVPSSEAPQDGKSPRSELALSPDLLIARRLVRLLCADGARSRASAAAKLGDYRYPIVVEGLSAAAEDEDPLVREHAARSLGRMQCVAAVAPLARALSDGEMRVRCAALAALAESRSSQAVEALADALEAEIGLASSPRLVSRKGFFTRFRDVGLSKEASAAFRVELVRELGRRAIPETVPALCRALKDPDVEVRIAAAHAVGELADARARLPFEAPLAALRRRVGSRHWSERRAVTRALEQVEAALGIAGITDLPLPAATPGTDTLPVPGTPPVAELADLPRPSSAE